MTQVGKIIDEVDNELNWMTKTKHSDGREGRINSILYSEHFNCPQCSHEFILWDTAVDFVNGKMHDEFNCSSCDATLKRKDCEKV